MTALTDNDLRELKDLINGRFNELDKKIDINIAVTNERLTSINGRLDIMQASIDKMPELNEKMSALGGKLEPIQASVSKIPELAEAVGELKNWRQITIIVLTSIISSAVTWSLRGGNLKP